MFAYPGYWPRLLAALMFLASTTLDGVDGELAPLKIADSPSGARLDTLTDNLVHVALFAGVMTGCYRASGIDSYLWLIPIFMGGFALCTMAGLRARRINGGRQWMARLEQLTGRDLPISCSRWRSLVISNTSPGGPHSAPMCSRRDCGG